MACQKGLIVYHSKRVYHIVCQNTALLCVVAKGHFNNGVTSLNVLANKNIICETHVTIPTFFHFKIQLTQLHIS